MSIPAIMCNFAVLIHVAGDRGFVETCIIIIRVSCDETNEGRIFSVLHSNLQGLKEGICLGVYIAQADTHSARNLEVFSSYVPTRTLSLSLSLSTHTHTHTHVIHFVVIIAVQQHLSRNKIDLCNYSMWNQNFYVNIHCQWTLKTRACRKATISDK